MANAPTRMSFKKEVKHSVVYETDDAKAPVRSIYVSKDWLTVQGHPFRDPLELEVKRPPL